MSFTFAISGPTGQANITVDPGSSVLFVGANGGGKTRLAVLIEKTFALNAHRISAHRALSLNPGVAKIAERDALKGLRIGIHDPNANVEQAGLMFRDSQRWHQHEAVSLLNDFDYLIQVLYADQANQSLKTHKKSRAGDHSTAALTKFERLVEIWDRLLPHRRLEISGDNIEVCVGKTPDRYPAAEMSDGERAIFYLIGQTLVAADNSLLIVDEPELHVHRSIMSKLWDELEASRQDCGFVFITHDLEFAATRAGQKYFIHDYTPSTGWKLEEVPENTGFGEEITTLILGSRRPILFVEGTANSIDLAIYRCSYPEWTVLPRGACEDVIHSVITMRRNQDLTRVMCAGIVDKDDYDANDIGHLGSLGVAVLPVSEIENVFLLPQVSRTIFESEGFSGKELEDRLDALTEAILGIVAVPGKIEAAVARYCRRRIDRQLKKIDLSAAEDSSQLAASYSSQTNALDITAIANTARVSIQQAVETKDLPKLLAWYDDKGLLSLAARHLKNTKQSSFVSWLTRVLRNDKAPLVANAIREVLPKITAQ